MLMVEVTRARRAAGHRAAPGFLLQGAGSRGHGLLFRAAVVCQHPRASQDEVLLSPVGPPPPMGGGGSSSAPHGKKFSGLAPVSVLSTAPRPRCCTQCGYFGVRLRGELAWDTSLPHTASPPAAKHSLKGTEDTESSWSCCLSCWRWEGMRCDAQGLGRGEGEGSCISAGGGGGRGRKWDLGMGSWGWDPRDPGDNGILRMGS